LWTFKMLVSKQTCKCKYRSQEAELETCKNYSDQQMYLIKNYSSLYLCMPKSFLDPTVAADKMWDSPIKSDMKLGSLMHLGAESQSEGTIQFVSTPWKMVIIVPRRKEEHEKEWQWQLGVVNEYVEWEEG